MSIPTVSRVIDSGSPAARRATNRSRVGSPSAAKIVAGSSRSSASGDIRLDVVHLLVPPSGVHAERLRTTGKWDSIEAGLGNAEPGTFSHVFEPELDERHRFVRVVHAGVDGVGMPAEGEQPL